VPEVAIAGSHAQYRGWAYHLADDDLAPADIAASGGSLTAPMPATVVGVDVEIGDDVTPGQVLVSLEAMKIQVQVRASASGTVRAVHVSRGDVVARGETLVELA
jgi:biotin carboxyl carrier protein